MFYSLNELFHNRVFLAAFIGWISAQIIKTIIGMIVGTYQKKNALLIQDADTLEDTAILKDMMTSVLWKTGGMPSSHTSMSSALTIALGMEEGFTSSIFLISFFFTTIVVRDAMGVRLLTGQIARKVNYIIKLRNSEIKDSDNHISPLKVVEGHSFSESFVGIVLGVSIGISIYLF